MSASGFPAAEFRAEILDANQKIVAGFSAAECIPLRTNNTLAEVQAWQS